ncbi:MAG TPA: 50S ribosomal protein L10 [Sphaerochaeta sp.]|nr:50S ribosomal protein L10 [Sphaerochaeta sp.]
MEYKTRITPAKEEAIKALKDEFAEYDGFIFADYRGMTVQQITTLRRSLLKKDATFRVVKNRFARLAFAQMDYTVEDELVGPTAIALIKGDEANLVAKDLFDIAKDGAPLEVKGGLIAGDFFSAEEVEALSKLPGRLQLIAALMATMKAPVQKLAATLLAYTEKLEAEGPVAEAPAAEEAKAEEPKAEKPEKEEKPAAEKKAEKPAEKKEEKPAAEKKAEKPAEKKAEKPAEKKAEKPAAEKKAEKPAEKKAEKAEEK